MKIAYLYTNGRKERLGLEKSGEEIPHEFFMGATELKKRGYCVDLFELEDLKTKSKTGIFNEIKYKLSALNTCSNILNQNEIRKLNSYEIVIATNEYIAFGIHEMRRKGVLTCSFSFFAMGMLSRVAMLKKQNKSIKNVIKYKISKHLYSRMIHDSNLAFFIGKGEYRIAKELFPNSTKTFIHFPIDTQFWKPIDTIEQNKGFILFIGNDLRRNYSLLVQIANNMPNEKFVFITKQIDKKNTPPNVQLLHGDWHQRALSDKSIRKYINQCRMMILPLKNTYQPSGQSVAQQAMSCKKTVLISDTMGFWDSRKVIDKEHIILIKDNNIENWIKKIKHNLDSVDRLTVIGEKARQLMIEEFSLTLFTDKLEKSLLKIKI